jgi:hypothetical protein
LFVINIKGGKNIDIVCWSAGKLLVCRQNQSFVKFVYFGKGRHFSRLLTAGVFALAFSLVEVVQKLCHAFVSILLATQSFAVFSRHCHRRTIVPSPK